MTRVINCLFFLTNFGVALGFVLKNEVPQITNPILTSIFFLGVIIFESITPYKLKNHIRILLFITLISHSLFGEYYRAYYFTDFFDNALHAFGSFTFALFAFDLMSSFIELNSSHPKFFTFIIVSLLGIGIGTLFELMEFGLDVLFNQENQFGLVDTNLDLLYDSLGSVFAGLIVSKWAAFN